MSLNDNSRSDTCITAVLSKSPLLLDHSSIEGAKGRIFADSKLYKEPKTLPDIFKQGSFTALQPSTTSCAMSVARYFPHLGSKISPVGHLLHPQNANTCRSPFVLILRHCIYSSSTQQSPHNNHCWKFTQRIYPLRSCAYPSYVRHEYKSDSQVQVPVGY